MACKLARRDCSEGLEFPSIVVGVSPHEDGSRAITLDLLRTSRCSWASKERYAADQAPLPRQRMRRGEVSHEPG